MKVKTDPTIQGMSGRFPKSKLVMNHRDGKSMTHSGPYVRPNDPEGQQTFKLKNRGVTRTYNGALSLYREQLQLYLDVYNEHYRSNDTTFPLKLFSFFTLCCHRAAAPDPLRPEGYDLSNLEPNSQMEALCGGITVWDLIKGAHLPECGFTEETLWASIY